MAVKSKGKKGKATHPMSNFPVSFSEDEVLHEKNFKFTKHIDETF